MRRTVLALVLVLLAAQPVAARPATDGEVRVEGMCGGRTTAELRAKSIDDGRLEVRFEVERATPGRWTIVLVHERRVAWRGSWRTTRSSRSYEVRRLLPDLAGADTVAARAWGPGGVTCRAAATIR